MGKCIICHLRCINRLDSSENGQPDPLDGRSVAEPMRIQENMEKEESISRDGIESSNLPR
jgi:hypothetical protein